MPRSQAIEVFCHHTLPTPPTLPRLFARDIGTPGQKDKFPPSKWGKRKGTDIPSTIVYGLLYYIIHRSYAHGMEIIPINLCLELFSVNDDQNIRLLPPRLCCPFFCVPQVYTQR